MPSPLRLRARRHRVLASRSVAASLVSVAGLVRRPVRNPSGDEVGTVHDVVVRWDGREYPPVTGLVVRVARRLAFVAAAQIESVSHDHVRLRSARLDLADFERRDGEVVLVEDVLDRQLLDVDGVRVIRASDLYLAPVGSLFRLVGVDVSVGTLARRLGPRRWRTRPTPERVIDWAAIQPFGRPGSPIRLREGTGELHRLHAGELADLLEELGRNERQELLAALDPAAAADALEEMEPGERESLLRESNVDQAAALLAVMEPDDAADALRGLRTEERDELLLLMSEVKAHELRGLLRFEQHTAGGLMTTHVVTVGPDATVADVRDRLVAGEGGDIDAVAVTDASGRLVGDVDLFQLFVAEPPTTVTDLVAESRPVTVESHAAIAEVTERFIDGRRSSLLVVDDDLRPIGRILADDLIDALARRGRWPITRRGLS
jgi:CBS domain-containing protein